MSIYNGAPKPPKEIGASLIIRPDSSAQRAAETGFLDDVRRAVNEVDPGELYQMALGREPRGYEGRLTGDELAEMVRLSQSRLSDLRELGKVPEWAVPPDNDATVPIIVGGAALGGSWRYGDPAATLEMERQDFNGFVDPTADTVAIQFGADPMAEQPTAVIPRLPR